MRNERTMNVAAVADETDIVCSSIFKNRWAVNNLVKICGQHSSQVSRIGVRPRHLERTNTTFTRYKVLVQGENEPKGFRKIQKAHSLNFRP